MEWIIWVLYFLNKIKACHVNYHSPKIETNVARTFGDIEVPSWLFDIYLTHILDIYLTYSFTLQNKERMGSNIWYRWRMEVDNNLFALWRNIELACSGYWSWTFGNNHGSKPEVLDIMLFSFVICHGFSRQL